MVIWRGREGGGGSHSLCTIRSLQFTCICTINLNSVKTEYRTHREFKSFLNQITICDFSSVQIKGKLSFGITGRINWLSILTSLPYSDLNITTIASHIRTHTLQHREVRLVKYTGVKSCIYIYIYFNHYPSSNRWSHTMSTILHNKSLFFIWKTKGTAEPA